MISGVVIFFLARFWWPFSEWINGWIPGLLKCRFYEMTGFPCITCGGVRSAYHFVRGSWLDSFNQNAGVFFTLFMVFFVMIQSIYGLIRKVPVRTGLFLNNTLLFCLACVFLIHWIIKIVQSIFFSLSG
ncbi:MAG: DUF2752 domain-containing protein [Candidatus Aureabacteria bacterium]|nr:DUF2752 domain-containing protein [Candidatus Auribacterota bacterium]